MNAKDTIETLMKLGVHMKDAFGKYSLKTGKGWVDFLASDDAKTAEGDVASLISALSLTDIQNAVSQIQAKEKAFLNGRKIAVLSAPELTDFHALLDAENALVLKEVQDLRSLRFWQWLVDDALPVLVTVAKIVIPLLT